MTKLEQVRRAIWDNWKQIEKAVPGHIDAGRLVSIASAAIDATPRLQKCSVDSLVSAIVKAAQVGIEPNDGTGRAAMIPRGAVASYEVMVKGLLHLAYQSGQIDSIDAHVVWDGDHFEAQLGTDPHIDHRPSLDHGPMIAVYAVIMIKGSSRPIIEILDKQGIDRIKRAAGSNSPAWRDWPEEMARKSVIKRALKLAPLDSERRVAIALDAAPAGIPVADVMPEASGWAALTSTAASPEHVGQEEMDDENQA